MIKPSIQVFIDIEYIETYNCKLREKAGYPYSACRDICDINV